MAQSFDYLIAGGGTTGCVLASRLSQAGHSVALFEAGPEDYNDKVMTPLQAPLLHGSDIEYNYQTAPQRHLDNRKIDTYGGRLLSGSSAVNYGYWSRCHSADYDAWAQLAADPRWGYSNMLKYFQRSESHHDPAGSPEMYGFQGPIRTSASARKYPLHQTMFDALTSAGHQFNPNTNGGNPIGFGAYTENFVDAKRQPAGLVWDLSKATVFTNATIRRIDLANGAATGLELADGRHFTANKEVLVCCGGVKTPQLLMLSGLGPAQQLSVLDIPLVADLPVGENLHDHCNGPLYWKLRDPSKGQAVGSAAFTNPDFFVGMPFDWVLTESIPTADVAKAAQTDGLSSDDPLLTQPRAFIELLLAYVPIGGGLSCHVGVDGTHMSTLVVSLLPTSRGRITLASTNPDDDPVIDPNYMQSETDKVAIRAGYRMAFKLMESPEMQKEVSTETPPPGLPQLSSKSSDADIDARQRHVGSSMFHLAGTAAMGKVVDAELHVKGVRNLRVCDLSVLPTPLAGHYQAPSYALAEAAADLIMGKA